MTQAALCGRKGTDMDQILLDFTTSRGTIAPEIYGHFSEHIGGVMYDGIWTGEGYRQELVDSFRRIAPPVLRWPGGCFAETYDWMDGIGPRDKRPERINWWYLNDGRTESNAIGTHEFVAFCRLVGAEPYFAANITSVSPLHIRNWIEYCNAPEGKTTLSRLRGENGSPEPFHVKWWGLGNENWGGGGHMDARQYARRFRQYRELAANVDFDHDLRFVACGPTDGRAEWADDFLDEYKKGLWVPEMPRGLSMHYYCGAAGHPLTFSEDEWYEMLFKADRMTGYIDVNRAAMDKHDPERKVSLIVDEWGCWHEGGTGPSKGYNLFEQQSTLRDAAVAGITLNDFNNRCDVVAMANVAQLVNNLHCLFLAGGEHFCQTPTYHVFDLYQPHKGARQIGVVNGCGMTERAGYAPMWNVHASASEKDGKAAVTLVNTDVTASRRVRIGAVGGTLTNPQARVLSSADPHDHNDFDAPDKVHLRDLPVKDGVIELPAASVACVTFDKV